MGNVHKVLALILAGCMASTFAGCGKKEEPPDTKRQTRTAILTPLATGEVVYGNDLAAIDASQAENGYLQLSYLGSAQKAKVQITIPDGTVYTYTLLPQTQEILPLTGGSGGYGVKVLENVMEDLYAVVFTQEIQVSLTDEFAPFLYPNQFAWFTQDSQAAQLGRELSSQASSDLDYVERVYIYVTENIRYDDALAQNLPQGYLPVVDETIQRGKGICFDYASLMTALLRSQGIPTKLMIGYSGTQYHAWISVYLEESGWVDQAIYFDGVSWTLMDPTLGASNDRRAVKKYVEDTSHYTVKYQY